MSERIMNTRTKRQIVIVVLGLLLITLVPFPCTVDDSVKECIAPHGMFDR